jgi:hypothetical protein
MAYTNIDLPTEYFNTKLYTGDGTTANSVTGVGFQPDLVWIKGRTGNREPIIQDSVRGTFRYLNIAGTSAENTNSNYDWFKSFNSDGFTVAFTSSDSTTTGEWNNSGSTYASWNWLGANTTASNTSGSITSTVSANTTSGFSIVSYTGTGATATVGHGLGVTPKMLIVKKRDSAGTDWTVWGSILGGTVGSEKITLNGTGAKSTGLNSSWFNNTAPTSTLFTIGTQSDVNGSGGTYIGYCFSEIKGYSKFGSYTGNGSTDGTFVYTGFKPAFVIIKQTSSAGEGWEIADNKRSTNNVITTFLRNSVGDESTNTDRQFDFVSNGIKMRGTHGSTNASGSTYIYMCFAENPFTSSKGIPCTAR